MKNSSDYLAFGYSEKTAQKIAEYLEICETVKQSVHDFIRDAERLQWQELLTIWVKMPTNDQIIILSLYYAVCNNVNFIQSPASISQIEKKIRFAELCVQHMEDCNWEFGKELKGHYAMLPIAQYYIVSPLKIACEFLDL